jgi:hypothetical protein
MGVRGSASRNSPSSTVRIFVSVATALGATLWLGNPCFAQGSYLLSHSGLSAAASPTEPAALLSDDEMRRFARATPGWEQASTRAGNHPADTVALPAISAMVRPLPAARRGLGHYTGLRLASTDVLLRGDSLTLRAGKRLAFAPPTSWLRRLGRRRRGPGRMGVASGVALGPTSANR